MSTRLRLSSGVWLTLRIGKSKSQYTNPVDSIVDALDRVPLRTLTQCQLLLYCVLYQILTLHRRLGLNTNTDTHTYKLCGRPPQYAPTPCKLTFDLLTL